MCHVKSPIHRLSDCPNPEEPKYYYYCFPVPSMYCCCCCCCPDVGPLRTLRGQHRGDATHGGLGANNNSDVSGNDSTVFAGRASVGARSGKMQTQSFAEAGGTEAPMDYCYCTYTLLQQTFDHLRFDYTRLKIIFKNKRGVGRFQFSFVLHRSKLSHVSIMKGAWCVTGNAEAGNFC